MSIRSFISINLHDDLKTKIDGIVKLFKETGADVRWVKTENLHLTLKFLGNIDSDKVDAISSRIRNIADRYDDFSFTLVGTGTFPDLRRPRIIWIGIKDHDNFLKIAKEVERAMEQEGFDKEKRPFSPHITVGRVRSLKGIDKLSMELVKYKGMDFGSQSADSIHLMKSTLKKGGAEYNAISSTRLRRNV
jgi:2'-5' RNA ligase